MSQFPSSIISFPTHVDGQVIYAADVNNVQDEVTALETKVGKDGSADTSSLDYIVKNPASDGGGHVQKANKGDTGQTSYAKGDLLVATSQSVIGKLSIGNVGEVLTPDTNATTGMKWSPLVANKVAVTTTSVSMARGTSSVETVLFAASILGSTLGTNNAIKYKGILPIFSGADNFTLKMKYGGGVSTGVTLTNDRSVVGVGYIEGMLVGDGANSQVGVISLHADSNPAGFYASNSNYFGVAYGQSTNISSVNSSADQNLVITGKFDGVSVVNSVLTGAFVVEKIV
jgi:hypothetical protein